MFETLPNPSFETLWIVGRGLLLFGAFWVFALAFIRWRRADERSTAQLHAQLERTFIELRSLHETVSVMSARLDGLSEKTEIESRLAPSGSQRGYDVATRLARNGADVEELVNNCGITRHEAELLTRLHGPRRAPEAPASAPAPRMQQRPAPQPMRASPPQPPPPPVNAGRKRGSLLSVVG